MSRRRNRLRPPADRLPRRLYRAEREQLDLALTELHTRGDAPPCYGDPRFTSEDHEERAAVLSLCDACPIRDLCLVAGRNECAGVWGGRDRTVGRPPSMYKSRSTTRKKVTP